MQDEEPIIAIDQDIMKNQIDPVHFIEKAHTNSIECTAVHPSRATFLTGSHDHSIKLWDAPKFKEVATFTQHKYTPRHAGKASGRSTTTKMAPSSSQAVQILQCFCGIPRKTHPPTSCRPTQAKFTLLGSMKLAPTWAHVASMGRSLSGI